MVSGKPVSILKHLRLSSTDLLSEIGAFDQFHQAYLPGYPYRSRLYQLVSPCDYVSISPPITLSNNFS